MLDIIRRIITRQRRPCEIKPIERDELEAMRERMRERYLATGLPIPWFLLDDEPPSPPRFPGGMGARQKVEDAEVVHLVNKT
jgi:hypothetical protein